MCSHFCFSNYLTSSLDREGAPGGPAGFTYRQGRGRLPLLHSRGVWGERASVPPGKGRPANGACFAEVISLESRGGMTGANSVASFQKRHSRRSFDNCGSAHPSRDLSNRKVPQEWRGGHACVAELAAPGGLILLDICLHGDLSTRGPHLGIGPSVDGRAAHGAVRYGAPPNRAKWSEMEKW